MYSIIPSVAGPKRQIKLGQFSVELDRLLLD